MSILRKFSDLVEKLCVFLCVVLTVAITFSAFMQVFSRFVLGGAWKWTDEACRYCLVWLAMIGAALGVKRHAHLAIDVVVNALPPIVQKVLRCVSLLGAACFGGVLVYAGVSLSNTVMQQRSSVLGLPMGLVYMAVPVFGALMAVF